MIFDNTKPKYIQIADYLCDKIVDKEWEGHRRIPSVRDLAKLLEVNANTIVHTYDYLGNKGLIYLEPGIGYYVTPCAYDEIMSSRKVKLIDTELRALAGQMVKLNISIHEVSYKLQTYIEMQRGF